MKSATHRVRQSSFSASICLPLEWASSPRAETYTVRRDAAAAGAFDEVVYQGSGLTVTDTGLVSGDTYFYVIEASNQWGSSGESTAIDATTKLSSPQNVAATDGSRYGDIRVSWSSVTKADSYRIYRAGLAGGTYSLLASTDGTAYVDSTVQPEYTYYYAVSAYSAAAGESEPSSPDGGFAAPPRGTLTVVNGSGVDRVQLFINGVWAAELRDYENTSVYGYTNKYSVDLEVGYHEVYAERPYFGYYWGPTQVFVSESGKTYTIR